MERCTGTLRMGQTDRTRARDPRVWDGDPGAMHVPVLDQERVQGGHRAGLLRLSKEPSSFVGNSFDLIGQCKPC